MEEDLKHSINYIREKAGDKSGFSTPKGYFDNLEDEILSQTIMLPKNDGFKVPDHYFDTLENEIQSKLSEEIIPEKNGLKLPVNYFENLEDRILSEAIETPTSEQTDFGIPKDYFASLEDRIFEKIQTEEQNNTEESNNTKVIPLYLRYKKYVPTLAAASIILFIATYFFYPFQKDSSLNDSDIVAWFDEGYSETSSYELASLLTDEDISDEELPIEISNDDSLEEYFNSLNESSFIDEIQ